MAHDELVARLLTSPDGYSETEGAILTQKLQRIYSLGMSVIRQGATDEEISDTARHLLEDAAEPRLLVGAVIVRASLFRSFCDPKQWFGVYATDEGVLQFHADVYGTTPSGSKNAVRRVTADRRYQLRDVLSNHVYKASTTDQLIAELRSAGI